MKLQSKILILFAIVFAGALGLRFLITTQLQAERKQEVNSDIGNIVKILTYTSEKMNHPSDQNVQVLNRFISDAAEKHDFIKEISITNTDGIVIASSNAKKIGLSVTDSTSLQESKTGKTKTEKDVQYQISLPILIDQNPVGSMVASVVISNANESFNEFMLQNIAITLFLFLLVSLIFYLGIRKLVKPLNRLVEGARKIESGQLKVNLPIHGSKEYIEVAQAFNSMSKKLVEVKSFENKVRDLEKHTLFSETTSSLAQEIRKPLNLINLTADHLAQAFQPTVEEKRKSYLEYIEQLKQQIEYLNQLVNSILTNDKPLRLKKELFDVQILIERILLLNKQELNNKNQTLECDIPEGLNLYADIELLTIIIQNILINAISMTPENGNIQIQMEKGIKQTYINIMDTGPGLSIKALDKIFSPYYIKRTEGAGLGLNLARRLTEAHKGEIFAENQRTGGARITITLPDKS